ncbi:unnamed protein product [Amoebophrya sp. A120]|nr:unnamed protein product [Amoebophrya sp. A120]|eukprot:GSA120T00022282001.1
MTKFSISHAKRNELVMRFLHTPRPTAIHLLQCIRTTTNSSSSVMSSSTKSKMRSGTIGSAYSSGSELFELGRNNSTNLNSSSPAKPPNKQQNDPDLLFTSSTPKKDSKTSISSFDHMMNNYSPTLLKTLLNFSPTASIGSSWKMLTSGTKSPSKVPTAKVMPLSSTSCDKSSKNALDFIDVTAAAFRDEVAPLVEDSIDETTSRDVLAEMQQSKFTIREDSFSKAEKEGKLKLSARSRSKLSLSNTKSSRSPCGSSRSTKERGTASSSGRNLKNTHSRRGKSLCCCFYDENENNVE